MRRWAWIIGILVIMIGSYWAWPFFGAAQLASAAQSGNSAAVIERVDLPALRRSLARQIANAYLKVSGKAEKLGSLGRGLAGAAATTVADPYVADLLTPENITALVGQGRIGTVKLGNKQVTISRDLPNFPELFRADVLSAVTGSSFDGIASFVIPIKTAGETARDYAVHLRLGGLTWRLSGVDLPPAIVEDMARAILDNEAAAAP